MLEQLFPRTTMFFPSLGTVSAFGREDDDVVIVMKGHTVNSNNLQMMIEISGGRNI